MFKQYTATQVNPPEETKSFTLSITLDGVNNHELYFASSLSTSSEMHESVSLISFMLQILTLLKSLGKFSKDDVSITYELYNDDLSLQIPHDTAPFTLYQHMLMHSSRAKTKQQVSAIMSNLSSHFPVMMTAAGA